MKSKIFIFTTLILVVFLFVITSCNNFLNAKNNTTININLDLSKILKTSRNETTSNSTEYILKVFAYNAASYKPKDEIENLSLLTQTENKVDVNGNVKARLDVAIGLNVIFVAKLYQGEAEEPIYAGNSEVIKIKATNNKVHLVLTRENVVPKGFVLVKGTTIKGTETWIPSSEVFVKGRELTIPNLLVSDHEVTRGEYKDVMGSDPSTASANDEDGNKLEGDAVLNNPVNKVNWYDALVYCNKLSINEHLTPCYSINGSTDPDDWGTVPTKSNDPLCDIWNAATCNFKANGYRLPTEAEWEWLARGGQDYTYAGSNTIDNVAWYGAYPNVTGTREVKTKAPNGYGLYDMSGNVYEWCWNEYSDSHSVLRGGSWYSHADYASVCYHNYEYPYYRDYIYGIRVVRTATEENLAHTHTFSTEWTSDETYHWYDATCKDTTEVSEKAEHSFVNEVCTICEYSRIPEDFVFVKGKKINGTELWTPTSSVFVSGRELTIPDLIVSDHEVTRGEYKAVMKSDPSTAKAYNKNGIELTGEDVLSNPVNNVSWYDALVYCNNLSIAEGLTPCYSISNSKDPDAWGEVPYDNNSQSFTTWELATCDFKANGYRLPTEAEWEWVARGGETYTYAGSNALDKVAWYKENAEEETRTREVKTKQSNAYGLYDMTGNVWEWCWDRYSSNITATTPADGTSTGTTRVFRDNYVYQNNTYSYSVCYSTGFYAYGRREDYGFRVVRTAPTE